MPFFVAEFFEIAEKLMEGEKNLNQKSPENLESFRPRGGPETGSSRGLGFANQRADSLAHRPHGLMTAVMTVVHAGDHAVLRVAATDEPLLARLWAGIRTFLRVRRRRAPGYRLLRQPCRRRDGSRRPCRRRASRKPGFPMISRVQFLTLPLAHLSIAAVPHAFTEDAVLSPRFGQ